VSRRNPRIRPNSLTQRNWRALQALLDEHGSTWGVDAQWHPYAKHTLFAVSLPDVTIVGFGRKWRGLTTTVVGGAPKGSLNIRAIAHGPVSTPRAAYLMALHQQGRK